MNKVTLMNSSLDPNESRHVVAETGREVNSLVADSLFHGRITLFS